MIIQSLTYKGYIISNQEGNSIIIAVILSQPISHTFWLKQSSKKFVNNSLWSLLPLLIYLIVYTIFWLLSTYFYHTPSHPIKINYYFPFISYYIMSGKAVTFCYYGDKSDLFLYSISPIALLKFNPPSILPIVIIPPAFYILSFSILFYGLWSNESGIAYPLIQSTERESPAFAQ